MSDPNFSQRQGITPLAKEPQVGSMDDELRNGLWNVITKHYLPLYYVSFSKNYQDKILYETIYEDFF